VARQAAATLIYSHFLQFQVNEVRWLSLTYCLTLRRLSSKWLYISVAAACLALWAGPCILINKIAKNMKIFGEAYHPWICLHKYVHTFSYFIKLKYKDRLRAARQAATTLLYIDYVWLLFSHFLRFQVVKKSPKSHDFLVTSYDFYRLKFFTEVHG